MIGTCVANKNPRLSLGVAGEPPVSYSFFGTPSVTLRKGDRSPITALTLQDEIPAETFGIRMQGCRVTLDVTFNEADVNSAAEAQTLIASIEADRDQKIQFRDRYLQLVQLSSAVQFLRAAGESVMTELTSPQMQELRMAAISSDEALKSVLTTCGSSLSQIDRTNLTELHGHLWVLGEPSKWAKPDGTPKTFADFLGPQAQQILTSIQNDTLEAAQLEAGASAAALAAERAIARVGIARQQLSVWLS
ncbi:MAG TPA: hypothetical protein VK524_04600 [Polyangiaceae bacterium]|nr:hypothetical protein [Polyangiaceae bacterium]